MKTKKTLYGNNHACKYDDKRQFCKDEELRMVKSIFC